MGKKTWTPGKNLQKFIAANFGIQPKEQAQMVEAISDAVADGGAQVREAMAKHDRFNEVGKRMLMAWAEGVQGLRGKRTHDVGEWRSGAPGVLAGGEYPEIDANVPGCSE